jgi:hypothetical protein
MTKNSATCTACSSAALLSPGSADHDISVHATALRAAGPWNRADRSASKQAGADRLRSQPRG